MKNYSFQEGSLTPLKDILECAGREKEEFGFRTDLKLHTMGRILSDIWDGKVKRVRRGPRGDQKTHYMNMTLKQNQVRSVDGHLVLGFEEMAKDDYVLPKGWFKVVDNPKKISLIRPRTWEFEKRRISTEISMELCSEKGVKFVIKSHGNEVSLEDLKLQKICKDLPVTAQAKMIIELLENSGTCLGCRFEQEMMSMVPHRVGMFRSLADPDASPQSGAFSSKCKLISPSAAHQSCTSCSYLKKLGEKRKERRKKRPSIDKHCNKRYLTKEEIELQLREEQRIKKNKHRRELYQMSASESEDDENQDTESEDNNSSSPETCAEEWVIKNGSEKLTLCRM